MRLLNLLSMDSWQTIRAQGQGLNLRKEGNPEADEVLEPVDVEENLQADEVLEHMDVEAFEARQPFDAN